MWLDPIADAANAFLIIYSSLPLAIRNFLTLSIILFAIVVIFYIFNRIR